MPHRRHPITIPALEPVWTANAEFVWAVGISRSGEASRGQVRQDLTSGSPASGGQALVAGLTVFDALQVITQLGKGLSALHNSPGDRQLGRHTAHGLIKAG